jgi:hypothetical protein
MIFFPGITLDFSGHTFRKNLTLKNLKPFTVKCNSLCDDVFNNYVNDAPTGSSVLLQVAL